MKQTTAPAGGDRQRPRFREQFWRQALRQFAAGSQSIREFCRSRGLSQPSFYSWRRRLARHDAAASAANDLPSFVPVSVCQEDVAQRRGFEIVLRGERRIRLSGPVDNAALAEVVAVLEGLPIAPESIR